MDDTETRERVARVEALLEEVESLPDPAAREKATEIASALLELYGEGFARIMGRLAESGGDLPATVAEDELVSHLLVLHDLHPVALETRVVGALEEVRPYLESHGGNVQFVGVEDAVVHLRLEGSCSGCPSSAMTLKLAIEDAILKAAPEIESVEADGAIESAPTPEPGLLKLEMAGPFAGGTGGSGNGASGNGASAGGGPAAPSAPAVAGDAPDPAWAMAGSLAELGDGTTAVKQVAGESVLFLKLGSTPYAYRSSCPGCGNSLESATLRAAELTCRGCGDRYDVQRAGRCLDAPERYLEPIPLLTTDDGLIKIAVAAAA